MSNCSSGANAQMKMIQARLDRIDDDLIAHYAGISELVAGLAANPVTAGTVVKSLRTYNFSGLGQRALKALTKLIPGYDSFKTLQHLDSSALVDGMADRAAKEASQAVDNMSGQVTAIVTQHADLVARRVEAAARLAQAVKDGVSQADRVALETAVTAADQALAPLTASLQQIRQISGLLDQFMGCMNDIASCRTRSASVG
jgi:hypothetical protein